jgi:predicted RNase H-like HicB family nuclease
MDARAQSPREDPPGGWLLLGDDREYPGVLATGDDLEELRASLEEGIRLMKAVPGEDVPELRLSELKLEPSETPASAELLPA